MSSLVNTGLINALQEGRTLRFSDELYLRELLCGEQKLLYMKCKDESFWRAFTPEIKHLTDDLWEVVSEECVS